MIDTVFNLDDFKNIIDDCKIPYSRIRICVLREPVNKYFTNIKIVLTAIHLELNILIECIVGERIFKTLFIDHIEEEKEKLKNFIKENYKKVEDKFGFIPKEGYWSLKGDKK